VDLDMSLPVGPKSSVLHQTVSRTVDVMGGYTDVWADTETFKAVLMTNSNVVREHMIYDKETVIADHLLYCDAKKPDRTDRAISTDDRIKYGTRLFDILFVDDLAFQNDVLKLQLRERDAD